MRYRSERRMCAFAEGLIEGAAEHFGERATIAQPQCMHRGDDHCVLEDRARTGMSDELERLQRRLERERRSRREAERIAEQTTRDLYDRQQELALLEAVAAAANGAATLERRARGRRPARCAEHTGWPVGARLGARPRRPAGCADAGIWHIDAPAAARRLPRARPRAARSAPARACPAACSTSGAPVWLADVDEARACPRDADGPRPARSRFPVIADGRIVAVLEFFARLPAEPDERLVAPRRRRSPPTCRGSPSASPRATASPTRRCTTR